MTEEKEFPTPLNDELVDCLQRSALCLSAGLIDAMFRSQYFRTRGKRLCSFTQATVDLHAFSFTNALAELQRLANKGLLSPING